MPKDEASLLHNVRDIVHRVPSGSSRQEGMANDREMVMCDRVAVRPCLSEQEQRGERTAGSGTVLDDQCLAGVLLKQLRLETYEAVERTSRRPGDYKSNRTIGEATLADSRPRKCQCTERGAESGTAAHRACDH